MSDHLFALPPLPYGTDWIRGWVGPRAGLVAVEKLNICVNRHCFQYAIFPWAVDRCKCSVSCFIPGLYGALLAFSINFHDVCLLTAT